MLDFISNSIHTRGYPPTLREIGAAIGVRSTNGVNDHLRALERKGYITRDDMLSRGIRPTDKAIADSSTSISHVAIDDGSVMKLDRKHASGATHGIVAQDDAMAHVIMKGDVVLLAPVALNALPIDRIVALRVGDGIVLRSLTMPARGEAVAVSFQEGHAFYRFLLPGRLPIVGLAVATWKRMEAAS